jgi:hypothetical protein
MAVFKNNFLDHVRLLRQAVRAQGAELIIAGDSMQALVRRGNQHRVLEAQFLATILGVRQYTPSLTDEVTHFAGWLPYRNRRWTVASDKMVFKRFAKSAMLNVPEFSVENDIADVLVKRPASSFGEHVKGPYRSASECPLDIAHGEYYERFIEGLLVKIWYWGPRPICAEVDNMPSVLGDGQSTIGDLILRRANWNKKCNDEEKNALLEKCELLLSYWGHTTNTVLPARTRQIIEFRYGSNLMHPRDRTMVDMLDKSSADWNASLREIGQALHTAIAPEDRYRTLYTVDAVRDRENKLWLLEMNSNPTVHPLAYPAILGDLFSEEAAQLATTS